MKVYLVEDATGIRNLLRASVEEVGGHVVGEAANQGSAISGIQKLAPDVVIVDLILEQGNGFVVIQEARKTYPGIVIIVMTGQAGGLTEKICIDNGADYYFEKSSRHYLNFERVLGTISAAYI